MEKKFKRTTVTSALPYANGPVHIGHLAGVYVPADIYVRYLRLKKEDVIFIGGSDEHGVPITIRAKKEGITPQDVVDRYHTLIKKSFEEFGVSFDVYSRTTSKTHHDTASDFFRKLYDKGEFIEKTSMQYYDEEVKTFLADRYITGECPHCHAEGAYGDQCEKCGTSLSPTDLINPKSAISGSQPVMRETKHWYLPLDKHEEWLRRWILEDHKEWRPNVYGQCKSWLDMGLQPRAVSRDLDWGIPVPVVEEVAGVAQKALDNIRTMGVALSPCIVPQVGEPTFQIEDDEIEIGMGIHGEKGIEVRKMMTADEVAETLVGRITEDMPLAEGDEVSVLVNGLGATPMEEQLIVYRRVHELLNDMGVKVVMPHVGEYATSMEMAGLSVTIFKLDEQLKELLLSPAKTPFYTNLNK